MEEGPAMGRQEAWILALDWKMSSVMLSNLRECMNLRECLIQKPASVNASAVCLKLCYGGQGKNNWNRSANLDADTESLCV